MATENIKSAGEVLTDFLEKQAGDDELDQTSVLAIKQLRGDGKLTRTNLLRKLDEARKAAMKAGSATKEGSA